MLQLLILTKASIPNIVNNFFRPNISLTNYPAFGASFQYIIKNVIGGHYDILRCCKFIKIV